METSRHIYTLMMAFDRKKIPRIFISVKPSYNKFRFDETESFGGNTLENMITHLNIVKCAILYCVTFH